MKHGWPRADGEAPNLRLTMVRLVTESNNTMSDGGVYTISNLKQLSRFKKGFDNPVAMSGE